jgi:ketosteroid isomerase-like protein
MPAVTDDLTLVESILSRMLPSGDIQPLLDALADDVVLTVVGPDGEADVPPTIGKAAVLDYFVMLGDLVTFWRVRQVWSDTARVVVLAEESFTLQPGSLMAQRELALLFELSEGSITRLGIVDGAPRAPELNGCAGREHGRLPALAP